MSTKAKFSIKGRNPDVLTCISNLSNDEVFTPPDFANQMLDTLSQAWAEANNGANIWSNANLKFLDPFTKSGVFLREIVARLTVGLADEIPDLEDRVNHIVSKQVFGIAVTELTGHLARRSVYCSKYANGEHSIGKRSFRTEQGNICYQQVEHTWVGGSTSNPIVDADGREIFGTYGAKCVFCGAPKPIFGDRQASESYSAPFIHTLDPRQLTREMFGESMKFDVVIGNPPYQMTDAAGGGVDSSIYHLFVTMAKKLEPRYLCMVIPSRWMGGATRGVGDFEGFRREMMGDEHISHLIDYPDSREVFPGVDIKGGVCAFVWNAAHAGPAKVTHIRDGVETTAIRRLNDFDVFVRDHLAVDILQKVLSRGFSSINQILTSDTPFGLASNFKDFREEGRSGDVALYYSRHGKRGVGYVSRSQVSKNTELIGKWKLLAPGAGSDGGQRIPDMVLGKPWLCRPSSVCTQTFLAFFVDTEEEAINLRTYYCSKFFRFLVSLRKITQNGFRSTYEFVPFLDLTRSWTDEELFDFFGLEQRERDYIEFMIRPMELGENDDD